jgi:hypothetical protein
MSEAVIVDFAAPEPEPTPVHRRIRLVSRALAWLFTGLVVVWGLLCVLAGAAFLNPLVGQYFGLGPEGGLLTIGPVPPHYAPPYVAVASLPLPQRLAHLPVGFIVFMPPLMILLYTRRLFGLYAQGQVFSPQNARCIQWIGVALVANAITPGLGVLFLTSIHMAIDHKWMHASSLQELILGGAVYVIAQVMQVGHELEEEKGQFI